MQKLTVGIIIYSGTGKTLALAEQLKSNLDEQFDVVIDQITVKEPKPFQSPEVTFSHAPDITAYDVLVFGAPVWAFQLTHVMKKYLHQLPNIEGKPVGFYVMQGLPFHCLGGNRAMRTMVKLTQGLQHYECAGIVSEKGRKHNQKFNKVITNLTDFVTKSA